MEKAKKVEAQNIDPELEFEIQKSRELGKPERIMIANTFIKRPVTAIVISLVLMISGIICLFNLAVDQYPNISPPSVAVNATYTGADAQTVEQTIAIPIEEQVNGTPGMEYMQSTSTNSGGMSIRVTFNIGTNRAYCCA